MKQALLFLLMVIPHWVGAAMPNTLPKQSPDAGIAISKRDQTFQKPRFFERLTEKIVQKRLKKAGKALGEFYKGEGKWLAIFGVVCGTLGAVSIISSILGWLYLGLPGFVLAIILGLGGLALSITGLLAATSWDRRTTQWIKALSVTGIVLNGLLILFLLGILALILAWG